MSETTTHIDQSGNQSGNPEFDPEFDTEFDTESEWLLRFDGFDAAGEGHREVLCTLANGYWGTRGAAPEARTDTVHYPGTYLAGVYNALSTEVHGALSADAQTHRREDEHLVNAPNWLALWFRTGRSTGPGSSSVGDFSAPDTGWFHPESAEMLDYRQQLDLRRGLLTRRIRYRDSSRHTTTVTSRRFVSRAAPHVAVLETTFEAEDWSGPLTVRSAIDGRVANRNVAADRELAHLHLLPRTARELGPEAVLLEVETSRSGIQIAMAARTRAYAGAERLETTRRYLTDSSRWVAHELDLTLQQGVPVRIEKVVVVSSSRDRTVISPSLSAATWLARVAEPAELLAAHELEWQALWEDSAVHLAGPRQRSLAQNLNLFHLLQTMAQPDADLDAGVPARGLTGEGHSGHVSWDELFVHPLLTLRRPDLSRALLGYRYRRLAEARVAARAAGHAGARFPWQSGIDGREVTTTEEPARRQQHVGLAVAYSVWQHYQATGSVDYLLDQGAELLLEIARYFASLTVYDAATDRYSIPGVMGPDDFHDGYPHAPGLGVADNTYTNVMTAWLLRRALDTVALLENRATRPLWNRLRLRPGELDAWAAISRRLRVPWHADGVISQFEGYESLPELDWARYRAMLGGQARLPGLNQLLADEGKRTDSYRVSRLPDVFLLFYLFSAEELRELFNGLGYQLSTETIRRTVEFYSARSTRGSALSRVVHAWVDARRDRAHSERFLDAALEASQTGTTAEGIHLAAMAGAVDLATRGYAGLEIRDDALWLDPVLPAGMERLEFGLTYRDHPIRLSITPSRLRLTLAGGGSTSIQARIHGQPAELHPGRSHDFPLD